MSGARAGGRSFRSGASEAGEQAVVVQWAAMMEGRWPELRWLHHIPNGGARSAATGAMLRRQGVKRGVPDLFLPCARGGWHGLYIEMKAAGGTLSAEQKEFCDYAGSAGYRMAVCHGADEAIRTIEQYMRARRARAAKEDRT